MSFAQKAIQLYLDGLADPSVACTGNLVVLGLNPSQSMVVKPCEVRAQCRLFRAMPENAQIWIAPGHPEKGCRPYRYWLADQQRQEENAREWVVTMCDQERIIRGKDPIVAAMTMFMALIFEGHEVPIEVILEQRYHVREK